MYVVPIGTILAHGDIAARVANYLDVFQLVDKIVESPRSTFRELIDGGVLELFPGQGEAIAFVKLPELANQHTECRRRWRNFGAGLDLYQTIEIMNNLDVVISDGQTVEAVLDVFQAADEGVDFTEIYANVHSVMSHALYVENIRETVENIGFAVVLANGSGDFPVIAITNGLVTKVGYEFVAAGDGKDASPVVLSHLLREAGEAVLAGSGPEFYRADMMQDKDGKVVKVVSTKITRHASAEWLAAVTGGDLRGLEALGIPDRLYQVTIEVDPAVTLNFNQLETSNDN